MLAHVGNLASNLFGQLADRQFPIAERLQDAQALRVRQGSRHCRATLSHYLEIADFEHVGMIRQLAQRRKKMSWAIGERWVLAKWHELRGRPKVQVSRSRPFGSLLMRAAAEPATEPASAGIGIEATSPVRDTATSEASPGATSPGRNAR